MNGRKPSPLDQLRHFASVGAVNADLPWQARSGRSRAWERAYRDRWQHDKVVRSTHGVNCTGSCSWKVHVKDGIITWETQQTDYPSNGPETPDYEPRGCPRGASFSWYTYSPLRVKYPYVRGALLDLWRAARAEHSDPVDAWASIAGDRAYTAQRGKGGFARASWQEVNELIAAAHVHTIERHGPDRIAGFSPIPAMSMASYAGGARFLSLLGGVCLSFYDWYADLPPASPQIWGDQTDVPESADWWDAGYLMMWGSNIPMTRTPDAHFMTEARYRGQKTVVVSPDYSDHTKFADHWLPAQPGTDGALAMAMTHVIMREFHVERRTPYFEDYVSRFTDLPFLVRLDERDGELVPGRYLRASDLGSGGENAEWKPTVFDAASARAVAPRGTIGDRWGEAGKGRWNLRLDGVDPALSLLGDHEELVEVRLPRFDEAGAEPLRRGVPVRRIAGVAVTTVFDLLCAQLGVHREGLPGEWPLDYDDASQPYTPAWQEAITGVDAELVTRIAREFARNAERTKGRSMIVMGAGTNHWFHSDLIYRAMLNLVLLCGCQGVNGGGWAHYVGQEKVRTITGFSTLGFGLDWSRPPRHQAATPFWYLATGQWRYDDGSAAGPEGMHPADCNALAARLGWLPSYPTFDRNPLDLVEAAEREGVPAADYVVRELKAGRLQLRLRGPRRARELPARAHRLALEPARLLEQGARVLPQAPARRRLQRGRQRGGAPREPPARRALARGVAAGQARPAGHARLPDERHLPALRRRPAGGHLVREARHLDHGPAPVRALLQPGDLAALGGAQRLGHVPLDRRGVLAAGRAPPRHEARPGGGAAPPRHAGRAGAAAWRRARLEGGRVRARPRADDAEARSSSSATTAPWRRR